MGFLSPLGKAIGKVTNSKVAKSAPGGKSIGKSLRNAPGMKQAPKPAASPIAPSPQMQAQQMPAVMNPPEPSGNQILGAMNTGPMAPPQEGLMNRMPGGDQNMQAIPEIGQSMGRPMVMPRTPEPQPVSNVQSMPNEGLAPSPQLMNRIPQRMPMRRMRPQMSQMQPMDQMQ